MTTLKNVTSKEQGTTQNAKDCSEGRERERCYIFHSLIVAAPVALKKSLREIPEVEDSDFVATLMAIFQSSPRSCKAAAKSC
mmetsp:Transcript_96436/g.152530  ORF Transcript_96436/g.152530 Transcript_96436/m.152530 type:complete len:82 (-) Transcript_96436:468-713(-)